MDGYHVALFLHIASLMAAGAAASLSHFAQIRRDRSTTVREAREWHTLLLVSSRAFPGVILTLLVTGGVMLSRHTGWSWQDGRVQAGLVGLVILGANGGMLGKRGKAMAADLAAREQASPTDAPPPMRDAVAERMSWMAIGIVVGEIFVMSNKPPLVPALIVVAISALSSVLIGTRVGGHTRPLSPVTVHSGVAQPV